MTRVIVHPVEYVLEIQNNENPEGILCTEGFVVRVHDLGGGPFISVTGRNLDPDEVFDSHTVTFSDKESIIDFCKALQRIKEKTCN